jgi:Na+(H+)/acetate symporter ActP
MVLGMAAVFIALKVKSVQALWYFTSDLVFVLLFPQLVMALFDKKANRTGSMVAFFVSLLVANHYLAFQLWFSFQIGGQQEFLLLWLDLSSCL